MVTLRVGSTRNCNEHIDTFDEVRDGYKKLHTMTLDKVEIMSVKGVGKREVATILSCEDFNAITTKGNVVVTEKHGTDRRASGTGSRQCVD